MGILANARATGKCRPCRLSGARLLLPRAMTCPQRHISLPEDESLFAGPPACSMRADSSLFAGLSLTCRTQALHRTHVPHSLDHRNERRQMQMVRLKIITRKSNANANAIVDKSFQLRPMRDTNLRSFNPDFFSDGGAREKGQICPSNPARKTANFVRRSITSRRPPEFQTERKNQI